MNKFHEIRKTQVKVNVPIETVIYDGIINTLTALNFVKLYINIFGQLQSIF